MALTVTDLRGLATGALTAAGEAASRAGTRAAGSRDRFGVQVLGPLSSHEDWSDGGQQAALTEVRDVHHRAGQIPDVLHGATPIVRTWAAELASAQATLTRLETQAALHGLTLSTDGKVEPAGGLVATVLEKVTDPTDEIAQALQGKIRAVLAEATAADQTCARHLLALLPDDGDPDSPWRTAATSVLAPWTRPVPAGSGHGGRGGNGGPGGPGGGTSRPGRGLTNFFRRLFKPNGPWQAPRPGNRWTGSGKTTEQLKDSGREKFSDNPKDELTRAGHVLSKHGQGPRRGHDKFPEPRGNQEKRNETGQRVVDDILDNPGTVEVPITRGKFPGGKYYIAPDGRGLAYDKNGVLQYWGNYTYPGKPPPDGE